MKKKINIILNKFAAIWLLMILINCPWPVINSCILSMVIFFVKKHTSNDIFKLRKYLLLRED